MSFLQTVNHITKAIPTGADTTVVAAVTGKVIEVISLTVQTYNAAQGVMLFYSASSAGLLLWDFYTPPNAEPIYFEKDPIHGLFRTLPSEALVGRASTQAQSIRITYRIY